jgi:hypothetical protein
LTQIKTTDISVLNERIHLYRHLTYTAIPASERKNEYHRRVSPIVRIGGRSRAIHIPIIKAINTAEPAADATTAVQRRLLRNASTAPATQHITAMAAYHIN